MKKIFIITISLLLVITITGCTNGGKQSNGVLTIKNNMGETEKKRVKELGELNCSNNQKFEKYYQNAKVSFYGKVASIRSDTVECAVLDCVDSDVINFEGGVGLALEKGKYDLSEIDKGTIIYIESTIAGDKCATSPSHLILKNLDNDSIPIK